VNETQTIEAGKSPPGWVDLALAEYNAHRTQSMAIFQASQQTLTFGATAVGIVITAGVAFWKEPLTATLIFLVVLPLLSVSIVVQWVGQTVALSQVAHYLEGLEDALRSAQVDTPKSVLTWESWLRSRQSSKLWKPDYRWYASAAIFVFGLLTLGSIILGAYRGWDGHETLMLVLSAIEICALAAIAVVLALSAVNAGERIRRQATARHAIPHRDSEPDGRRNASS
jgi:hypothetical protein